MGLAEVGKELKRNEVDSVKESRGKP